MHFERAKEIYHSLDKIEVFHNGKSVWMNNLDSADSTAEIKYMYDKDFVTKVPVNELSEGGMMK